MNRTPVKGTLDATAPASSKAEQLIASMVALVALGGTGTEAEMWERIATAYAKVTGAPLDRAEPYNVALASAVLNHPSIGRLLHDELPAP